MIIDARLQIVAAAQPYPLLFATISGAHLYGFPSPDSDYDLRGAHILPVEEVIGLDQGRETIETSEVRDGLDLDLVTHDIRKFCTLLLKRNGYVLEQLYSPLVVVGSEPHDELRAIAAGCFTRHHAHHYLGFAETQWKLYEEQRRLKPLLYVFRVLKTGIHLLRTGRIEADLRRLLDDDPTFPYLGELIAAKQAEGERTGLPDPDNPRYAADVARLRAALEAAHADSQLPEAPSARAALHDFVIRNRFTR